MIPGGPSRIIFPSQDPSFNHICKVPLAVSGTIFAGFRGWDVDISGRGMGGEGARQALSVCHTQVALAQQFLADTKLSAGGAKMPGLQRPFPGKLNL